MKSLILISAGLLFASAWVSAEEYKADASEAPKADAETTTAKADDSPAPEKMDKSGAPKDQKVSGPQPSLIDNPDPYKHDQLISMPLAPKNPFRDIKGDDVDKGGDVTKACRYDEPHWSNCDPFELTKYKVFKLVSGGRQCEEEKRVTERCTPYDLPAGTKWLIAEHRRCISEMKKLKLMVADMAKYITALREKGKTLFDSYLVLRKHLNEMTATLKNFQTQVAESKEKVKELRKELEAWRAKSRELQQGLDQLKKEFEDLKRDHELGLKRKAECEANNGRCINEVATLRKTLEEKKNENTELKRRLLEAQKYKDELTKVRRNTDKVHYRHDKLQDKLDLIKDEVAECKIDLLNKRQMAINYKDTKMDLSMDMLIVHNRSDNKVEPEKTTLRPKYEFKNEKSKCLISYYGATNETCWYKSNTESIEADFQDTLGEHQIEATWKYFTIDVVDQYECDRAAKAHYEFLINRCKPEHHLPVLSMFRSDESQKELDTHIYPKPNIPQPNHPNRCWITFLGPQGHCERRRDKYPLYNSDDTIEGYHYGGSGMYKSKCLARAKVWTDYCENPAIATYLPEGKSSNWQEADIVHDNHGGRMFEESYDIKGQINPNSLNPTKVAPRPKVELPKTWEDTEEYRKSLNLPEGPEKEALLQRLKERLGLKELPKKNPSPGESKKVEWQGLGKESGKPAQAPADKEMPKSEKLTIITEAPKTEAPKMPEMKKEEKPY